MAEFVLHVADIDEAGRDYAFELSPAWLDAHLRDATLRHDPDFGPGGLEGHVQDNGGGEYLVTGSVQAHVVTECSRCLGDAKVVVDTSIAALFARTSGHAAAHGAHGHHPGRGAQYERHQGDDEEEDDLPREEFSGNVIALDDLVREHIVLEVPMQPLCSEQCQGIAVPAHLRPPADAFPGADAVDPRLAPLQRLRDNVPPTPETRGPAVAAPQKQTEKSKLSKPKSNKE